MKNLKNAFNTVGACFAIYAVLYVGIMVVTLLK
jgi:hypothetical protein